MKRVFAVLLGTALLQGCATEHTGIQCRDNFTSEGNVLVGQRFSTISDLPMQPASLSFKKAQQVLVKNGYHLEAMDEKSGVISAYQNVHYSTKTAPVSVIIEPLGQGSRMTITCVTTAGLYTPSSGAETEFCHLVDETLK